MFIRVYYLQFHHFILDFNRDNDWTFLPPKKFKLGGASYTRYTQKFLFMPLHMALCLAMSPSSVIGVLTHHSETRTTLKFVCHLGLKVIFLIDLNIIIVPPIFLLLHVVHKVLS